MRWQQISADVSTDGSDTWESTKNGGISYVELCHVGIVGNSCKDMVLDYSSSVSSMHEVAFYAFLSSHHYS